MTGVRLRLLGVNGEVIAEATAEPAKIGDYLADACIHGGRFEFELAVEGRTWLALGDRLRLELEASS